MNDLELIRHFRSDVEPPDTDRVAAARATLASVLDDSPGRRRGRAARRRPLLAASLAAPAIAAAAAALLVAAPFGGDGPSTADAAIIRHADAALSPPPNEILHTKEVGDGFMAEWWQLTSAPYTFLGEKGPVGVANPEAAGNATTASYYDPATNTIHAMRGGGTTSFGDPVAQVHQMLDEGRARVLGSARVDGVDTYKIQFAEKDNGFTSQSLIAYVDQRTYRPVLLSDPQRDGTVVDLRVVTLEYLPATPANLQSLSLTARHPGAQVLTGPASSKSAAPAGK
jgi:hypothetical protein